nr:MAG TPA: hypothetical protein [Bacteriophage sp.]
MRLKPSRKNRQRSRRTTLRNRDSFPLSKVLVANLKNRTIQSEKLRGLYKEYG